MAGQGSTTIAIAELLSTDGWQVAYTCIPNTPHLGAVPIPTAQGGSRQRYPDIVACRGDCLAIIEVEITVNSRVARDIVERFGEMREALSDPERYSIWRAAVLRSSSVSLPEQPRVVCQLVICRGTDAVVRAFLPGLATDGIGLVVAAAFQSDDLDGDDTR